MTRKERAQILFNFLNEKGYNPEFDRDGDISFRNEGHFFLLLLQDVDSEFYQLAFPNFWALENDEERFRAVKAAHDATAGVKAAKISVTRNDTWGNVELFCSSPEEMAKVLERSMNALLAAVKKFATLMRNENKQNN